MLAIYVTVISADEQTVCYHFNLHYNSHISYYSWNSQALAKALSSQKTGWSDIAFQKYAINTVMIASVDTNRKAIQTATQYAAQRASKRASKRTILKSA